MAMVETDSSEGRVGQSEDQDVQRGWTRRLLRWAPLLVIAGGLAAALIAGVDSGKPLTLLEQNHAELGQWVSDNLVLAIAVYAAIYAVSIALSVPGGAVLTLTGGFLFGAWAGTAIVVVAATLGATGLFLAARAAVGESLTRKPGRSSRRWRPGSAATPSPTSCSCGSPDLPVLDRQPGARTAACEAADLHPGHRARHHSRHLRLRLLRRRHGQLLAAGADITVGDVLSLEVILGLTGLALLALVPIALRAWRRRGADNGSD